jgi:hypothetical protein
VAKDERRDIRQWCEKPAGGGEAPWHLLDCRTCTLETPSRA